MSVSKAGKRLVLVSELCELVDDLDELSLDYFKSVTHYDNIGVVADVAARCAHVYNALRIGAGVAVGVNVCHNVVAEFLFILRSLFVVDVVDVGGKFVHLSLSNVETELHLGTGKSDPKLSPGREFLVCGENELHLLACVSCAEWAFIAVCHSNLSFKVIKTQIIIPYNKNYCKRKLHTNKKAAEVAALMLFVVVEKKNCFFFRISTFKCSKEKSVIIIIIPIILVVKNIY